MTQSLVCALANIVGLGAQHEHTCDQAEHDGDSGCIWCEARAALLQHRTSSQGAARRLMDTINAAGGLVLDPYGGVPTSAGELDWVRLQDAYLAACSELGTQPQLTIHSED